MDDRFVAVTETPYVEKSFIWRIKKFADTMGQPDSDPISMKFTIGSRIGQVSSWKLTLTAFRAPGNHRKNTQMILDVVRTAGPAGAKSKDFICKASVKNKAEPDVDVACVEINQKNACKQFGIFGTMMEAVVGDVLDIQVKFEWNQPETEYASWTIGNLAGGELPLQYRSGKLLETSDFVIRVKGEYEGEWTKVKLHKAFVGGGSYFFQRLLNSGTPQVVGGDLFVEDLSLLCIRILVQFVYMRKLRDMWKDVAAELALASVTFDLPVLKGFLDRNLISACTTKNFEQLRGLAQKHGLKKAEDDITMFVFENIDEIF